LTALPIAAFFVRIFAPRLKMENSNRPKPQETNRLGMINLAMEFGYIIALPIVTLGLLGKWLDGRYGTKPWITLGGILLAILVTSTWLSRRIKEYIQSNKT
jgi:hypothetical protein